MAKTIQDKTILKWQICKLRNSAMKIILANQSMMDELSHMLKNEQSKHGMHLPKKQSSYCLLASIPYDSSPYASDDSSHNAAKTFKTAYIMTMIKCLFIIHTILLDQPITY